MKIIVDIPREELEKMDDMVSTESNDNIAEWNNIRSQWVGRILGYYWQRRVLEDLSKEKGNGWADIC